jgi:Zn-finger nucleic acid-binding protein
MRKTRKRKKILWCRYNWCVLSVSGEVNQCGGIYKYPHSIRKWIERTRIAPYLAQQQEATEHSRAPRNTRERERENKTKRKKTPGTLESYSGSLLRVDSPQD